MVISVAVLGATGVVGQKVIALLSNNPLFKIIELVASERRVGYSFHEACDWREPICNVPDYIANMRLCDIHNLKADFVISCLPSEIAKIIEPNLASQGKIVFSNASAFRMSKDVPLLIPEINYAHLSLLSLQSYSGKIIANPNCSATGIALALAPLTYIDEIDHVSIVTLQSISGAGYPGIPSLDILGNTIPHIPEEAEKITGETKKILGSRNNPAQLAITTHVHRVPVMWGHTATLHITFKHDTNIEIIKETYESWNNKYNNLFILHDKCDRPQSTKDLTHDDMRVHIGNIKQGDKPNIAGLVVLTNNLVRGAAGAVITNMENYLKFIS